jgi:hypothetical protein
MAAVHFEGPSALNFVKEVEDKLTNLAKMTTGRHSLNY